MAGFQRGGRSPADKEGVDGSSLIKRDLGLEGAKIPVNRFRRRDEGGEIAISAPPVTKGNVKIKADGIHE